MPSTFHVEHFGCRAARADGEAVSDRLRSEGLLEQHPSAADLVVVNTCSVTAEADRAARAFIRRAHRLNPNARIVVTGCYAQRAPQELAAMDGVAAVVGNSHKALAPGIILGLVPCQQKEALKGQGEALKGHDFSRAVGPQNVDAALAAEGMLHNELGLVSVQSLVSGNLMAAPIWADDRFAHSFLEEAQLLPGAQTRPNLKIQEGCGNRCSFCVIPQTRGSSKSLPAENVLRQIQGFVAGGGNELVLSGINLGRWGRDFQAESKPESLKGTGFSPYIDATRQSWALAPEGSLSGPSLNASQAAPNSLASLVRQIFNDTALPRLRLSSIEPMDWDADLIALMAEFGGSRLARHAHLPLQSGSDAVLRRMHRRYRPWHYAEKVQALLRVAGPDLTLGADVMAGFPGETDLEFEETVAFIRALPFGYLHLFPFSPRPNTRAWTLHAENPVPRTTVEERMTVLRALAAKKSLSHRRQFIGRDVEAITLHTSADLGSFGRTSVMTENFLPVELDERLPANKLVRARIEGLSPDGTLMATAHSCKTQYEATTTSV